MAKKSRKHQPEYDYDPYGDFDDISDNEMDMDELSKDIYSTEWGSYAEKEERISARRKIERRNDQRKLYSELNDWEEFGDNEGWNAY